MQVFYLFCLNHQTMIFFEITLEFLNLIFLQIFFYFTVLKDQIFQLLKTSASYLFVLSRLMMTQLVN